MEELKFKFCGKCKNNDETCSLCNICNLGSRFEPKGVINLCSDLTIKLIMASTVDGKIAKNKDHAADWTSICDKKYFVEVTKSSGVVVMGMNTFKTIGRSLPERLNVVYTHKTELLDDSEVLYTQDDPLTLFRKLKGMGYNEICAVGGSFLNTSLMHIGLIDEIHLTIIPKLFGSGLSMFSQGLNLDRNLELKFAQLMDDKQTVLLIYKVIYGEKNALRN